MARGAQFFHEQTGQRIRLDERTIQAVQWIVSTLCTVTTTRRPGKNGRRKYRAQLNFAALDEAICKKTPGSSCNSTGRTAPNETTR
jgi:hypothetical protein